MKDYRMALIVLSILATSGPLWASPNVVKIASDLSVTDAWFFSGEGETPKDAAKASASAAASTKRIDFSDIGGGRVVTADENFGVGMKFASLRENIRIRIELHVPQSPERFPSHAGKVSLGPDGKTVLVDYEILGSKGKFAHYWGFGKKDPIGRYEMKLYVEGVLIKAYTFYTERNPSLFSNEPAPKATAFDPDAYLASKTADFPAVKKAADQGDAVSQDKLGSMYGSCQLFGCKLSPGPMALYAVANSWTCT